MDSSPSAWWGAGGRLGELSDLLLAMLRHPPPMHQHPAAQLAEMIAIIPAIHKAAMPTFPAATDKLVAGEGSAAGERKKREHLFFLLGDSYFLL